MENFCPPPKSTMVLKGLTLRGRDQSLIKPTKNKSFNPKIRTRPKPRVTLKEQVQSPNGTHKAQKL